jgi:cytochrome c oxidase subunit 2
MDVLLFHFDRKTIKMERVEAKILYVALTLMVVFAALVIYAAMGLGVALPTCNDRVVPFTEGKVIPKENNHFEVHYVARMWSFEPAELILPEKAEVDVYVSAIDVDHGFEIPGTNLNLMAIPGSVNYARYRFDRKGDYMVICHEYCGLNHHNMMGKIKVVSADEYKQAMLAISAKMLSEGERLMEDRQCSQCHTSDGTESLGPTFKGLYESRRNLSDGSEVIADEAYLIDAIRSPDKHIVRNYEPGSMPPPDTPLTDQEIKQLIDYIKSLQ